MCPALPGANGVEYAVPAALRPAFARRVAISRVLQGASGALLLVISVLLLFDHERALFDPIFRLLARI